MTNLLQIFISYASEDQKLVEVIVEALNKSFRAAISLTYMSQFDPGIDYREEIDRRLDSADILLVVASGKLKLSHSFTGYEVGYFRNSQRTRPKMRDEPPPSPPRMILPVAVLAEQPDAVAEIQGIQLPKENRLFLSVDPIRDNFSGSGKVIYKLLSRIDEILGDLNQTKRTLDQSLQVQGEIEGNSKLFAVKFDDALRTTPIDQQLPKIKFTLSLPRGWEDHKDDLSSIVNLTVHGPTSRIFSSPPKSNFGSWPTFQNLLGDSDLALSWKDAIESLMIPSLDGDDFSNEDQLVLSYDETQVYRLFVSKSTLYFDRSREIDVYVIPILHTDDKGDPLTTYLEKAIGVGLRFRSLFLEKNSPYAAINFKFVDDQKRNRLVKGMLKELRVLMVKTREARLSDPQHIATLFGTDDVAVTTVADLTEKWNIAKSQLYNTAGEILKTNSPDLKKNFISSLETFCKELNEMNKLYLGRAVARLKDVITSPQE